MKRNRTGKKTIQRSWMMTGLFLFLIFAIGGQSQKAKAADISGKVSLVPSTTELTRKDVIVSVNTKKLKVHSILWKQGKTTKKSMKKWRSAKNITLEKYFTVKMDGTYSVRVKDKKKNVTCKTIRISNIDKEGPVFTYKRVINNKVATVSIVAVDITSGVGFVGYSKGYLKSKKKSDYTKAGAPASATKVTVDDDTVMDATHQFKADTQGYYTIMAKDTLGNATLQYIKVKLWDNLADLTPFDRYAYGGGGGRYAGGLYKGTIYDRWRNTFTNPIGIDPTTSGICYVEYFLNGKYKKFSGTIIRGRGIYDDDTIWLEILADDIVIYTSSQMNYKSNAISFDVSINNARYIKIRAYSIGDYDYDYSDDSRGIYIINGQLYN